jgi:hypothetical protein
VFEGDRSFDIVVRLPEDIRGDIDALKSLPVSLPLAGPAPLTVPLVNWRPSKSAKDQIRSAARTASDERHYRERSGSRHRIRRTRPRADRNGRHPATRLLVIVGRPVRKSRRSTAETVDRGAGLLCSDLPAVDGRARHRTRRADRV